MNSPSASPHVLKTKNSQTLSGMSTSLRERLKKCGRYHPGFSPRESPTGTATLPANILCSQHTRTAPGAISNDVQINQHIAIDRCDDETPKRKTFETLSSVSIKNSSDIIKRRKLDYSKESLDKNSISHQVEIQLPSSPDPELEALRVNNENILSYDEPDQIKCDKSVHSYACTEGSDLSNGSSSLDISDASLKDVKAQLERELKMKEEQIRKLKMVKMYREKNNLTELQKLIDTWRDVSQQALVDLHDLQPPPKPTMTELINHLQIDHDLIHFVADEETFS